MSIRNILARSNGSARLVKIPDSKRPTAESLANLNREISAQISANDAMRSRSMQNASKASRK